MRLLKFAALAALLVLPVVQVEASVLSKLLTTDGVKDSLNDESRSSFFDNQMPGDAGFGTLSVGDVVYGFAAISDVDRSGVGNVSLASQQLVGTFAIEVTGLNLAAGVFTHGPVSAANTLLGQDIGSLLGGTLAPGGGPGAAFVVLSHTGISPEPLDYSSLADFTDADWDYEVTLGFAAGDFLHIEAVPSALGRVDESAGLSVLDGAPGLTFVDDVEAINLITGATTTHQVNLTGTVDLNDAPINTWFFNDQARFEVNVVPEPTTVVVWGILGSIAGVTVSRRRKTVA